MSDRESRDKQQQPQAQAMIEPVRSVLIFITVFTFIPVSSIFCFLWLNHTLRNKYTEYFRTFCELIQAMACLIAGLYLLKDSFCALITFLSSVISAQVVNFTTHYLGKVFCVVYPALGMFAFFMSFKIISQCSQGKDLAETSYDLTESCRVLETSKPYHGIECSTILTTYRNAVLEEHDNRCFTMAGDNGFLSIHLKKRSFVHKIILDQSQVSFRYSQSSIKNFIVLGKKITESQRFFLGDFNLEHLEYNQTFIMKKSPSVDMIIIEVLGNHCERLFTTICKVFVYGIPEENSLDVFP